MSLAVANDSTAGLDGGNIDFRKSDGIELLQEQLSISPERVRVRYEFRNTTAADIRTRIGFPIPPFDKEPDGDVGYDPNSTNPLAFSTKVTARSTPPGSNGPGATSGPAGTSTSSSSRPRHTGQAITD